MLAGCRQRQKQRREFLSDVIHELRTPITVIQGNLEGILDGLLPGRRDSSKLVLDETQLLARLVEDLRTWALAESGRAGTEPRALRSAGAGARYGLRLPPTGGGARYPLRSRPADGFPTAGVGPGAHAPR